MSKLGNDFNENSILIYFGYKNFLKISSYQDGINWCLYVNNKAEEQDYLSESPVTLELLSLKKEYISWYKSIPIGTRKSLKPYSIMSMNILYHISHYKYALDIYSSSQNLLWFILFTAKNNQYNERMVTNLFSKKRRVILEELGVSNSNTALKLLNKFKFEKYDRNAYNKICEALNLPSYTRFNDHQEISLNLLSTLISNPMMTSFDLGTWGVETKKLLKDIGLMIASLSISDVSSYQNKLNDCKNNEDIKILHRKLIAKKIKRQSIERLPKNNFPKPPLGGTERIIPILGTKDLIAEGKKQHSCIDSYNQLILEGKYYIYKVYCYPERASLGFFLKKGSDKVIIDQLFLCFNKAV